MLKNLYRITVFINIFCFLFCFVFLTAPVSAQEANSLTLTISPPLLKVNINPGEKYNSQITVVNNNNISQQIYVSAQDFKSNSQGGAEFIPAGEEGSYKYSLSRWLEFEQGPVEIPAQQSRDIPFTINLPADAEPGGHYAALLVGTKPAEKISGTGISVASMLASLIMVQAKGDTEEKGDIREFSTDKKFYDNAKVNFKVNFNNSGNVHLQPRGEIKIYNFFNQEKGSIAINQQSEYGNVLPNSSREWQFAWSKKTSLLDMGRYKAVLFLTFGQSAQETVSQTLFFWLVFVKPLLIILGSSLLLVILIILLIRRYIRKAVMVAQTGAGMIIPNTAVSHKISVIPESNGTSEQLAPIKSKQEIKMIKKHKDSSGSKTFWLASLLALLIVSAILFYLYKNGTIKIIKIFPDKESSLDQAPAINEEISNTNRVSEAENKTEEISEELATTTDAKVDEKAPEPAVASTTAGNEQNALPPATNNKENISIIVLNGSGQEGVAKKAQDIILMAGYKVKSIGNADNYNYLNTVIQYTAKAKGEVENIRSLLSGENEIQEIENSQADAIIIIGSSFK